MADNKTQCGNLAENLASLIGTEAKCEAILPREGQGWLLGVVTEAPPGMVARGAFLMCANGVWYEVTVTPANK